MNYELWKDEDNKTTDHTFCVSGPEGDNARKSLSSNAKLIWECEAKSYNEAMQKYYTFMNWGKYKPIG